MITRYTSSNVATRMDGYFKEGQLDSIRAAGLAETIYYIQDDDSAYTGINESRCDIIESSCPSLKYPSMRVAFT